MYLYAVELSAFRQAPVWDVVFVSFQLFLTVVLVWKQNKIN